MNFSVFLWPLIMSNTTSLNKEYFEYVGSRLTVASLFIGVTIAFICALFDRARTRAQCEAVCSHMRLLAWQSCSLPRLRCKYAD